MAATPERKVKDKVVSILKQYGAYYFFPATGGYGRSGVPDIVCCFRGKFLAFECKAGSNKTTALQDREIINIIEAGGHAFVIDEKNIDLVSGILKLLRDEVE
jgi:Holliday junction resolvase